VLEGARSWYFSVPPVQLDPQFAVGTLRLSVGRHTTPQEIDQAVSLIAAAAAKQGVAMAPTAGAAGA